MEQDGRYLYLFLINGMITAYLDLLTYPAAALGIPLVFFLATGKMVNFLEAVKKTIGAFASWAFGYFGIWSGKWLIGSLVLKRNVLADAMNQAKLRTVTVTGERVFARSAVFLRNIKYSFYGILIPAVLILGLFSVYLLWRHRYRAKQLIRHMLPYLILCLLPFVKKGCYSACISCKDMLHLT